MGEQAVMIWVTQHLRSRRILEQSATQPYLWQRKFDPQKKTELSGFFQYYLKFTSIKLTLSLPFKVRPKDTADLFLLALLYLSHIPYLSYKL